MLKTERRWLDRLTAVAFRERQILIREGDTIRTVALTPRRQKWLAGVLGVSSVLLLSTSGGVIWQQNALHRQMAEIDKAQAQHSALEGRVDRVLSKARDLRAAIPAAAPDGIGDGYAALRSNMEEIRAALHQLAERRDVLGLRLERSERRRNALGEQLGALRREKTEIAAELADTRQTLRDVSSGRENLGDRLAETLSDLHRARARAQAAMSKREDAERRAEDLKASLARMRDREAELVQKVGALTNEVSKAKAARDSLLAEREKLAGRVGRLERTLGHVATAEQNDLISRIGDLETALVAAEKQNDSYMRRETELEQQVARLQSKLKKVRKAQSGLFNHYSAQAESSLATIEKTVAMTGLDVDKLIGKAGDRQPSTGGPFVPAAFDGQIGQSAQQLDRQMQRLRILQDVLSRLPLTPPLDSYWVSSYFGKRRDPYNGRWAMHEGIDMAGQAGLKIRAGAPGRVVKAGWKGGYGRVVEIDHGYGISTLYGHLKSVSVNEGDHVKHRGAIGRLGNTGRSTGPHVHYEIQVDGKPVDPMNFLKAGRYVFKE